ncbi:hypothetical protein GSI_14530 [Ganoderma sinense ZZ0214-1]|uniref:Peptidase A1 domain-containing protein n=1 Tax=Ganoderma sinense ZZ0214-1 TaxID=1077348 RepID=A0A2G8RP00_9APHY|nr:hypothetical protein GSI_14530 [Ganoderma sinense ZZ0214-1]
MPHTFVHLKLNPKVSAYWLPLSGQQAAEKIPVRSFWALRANWYGDEGDPAPGFIFVVSSQPSPYPLVNASLTLGPKLAHDTGVLCEHPTALRTMEPIMTENKNVCCPLYLHAAPMISINPDCRPLVEWFHYRLDAWSLEVFIRVARELFPASQDFREWQKRSQAKSGGPEGVEPEWSSFDGGNSYIIGGRNDPRTFVFKFLKDPYPSLEGPPTIYEEIRLYKQLCKDYKWKGAQETIDWVANVRKESGSVLPFLPTVIPASPPVEDPSWAADALSLLHKRYPPTDTEAIDYDSDNESEFVPRSFPHIMPRFSEVATPSCIKIVVFDIFGVILDREGAIRRALTPWTMVSGCTKDATQLTRLYLESEALADSDSSTQPTSLARIVYCALLALAERLDLPISPASTLFTDAFTRILSPAPFADAEPAITALAARGVRLVCFPAYSSTTMEHLRSMLPAAFHKHVELAPLAMSVHFAAGDQPWWKMYDRCRKTAPDVCDDEFLVVSAGVGRVLLSAIRRRYATALVKRPDSLESHVEFVIGELPEHNPIPLMTVPGLMELYNIATDDDFRQLANLGAFIPRLVLNGVIEQPMFSPLGQPKWNIDNSSVTWVPVRLYDTENGGIFSRRLLRMRFIACDNWEVDIDGVCLDGQQLPNSKQSPQPGIKQPTLSAVVYTNAVAVGGPQDVVKDILSTVSPAFASNSNAAPTLPCGVPHNLIFQIGGKSFAIDANDFVAQSDASTCVANVEGIAAPGNQSLFSWSLGQPFLRSNLVVFYYGNFSHTSLDPPRMGFVSLVGPGAAKLNAAAERCGVVRGWLSTLLTAVSTTQFQDAVQFWQDAPMLSSLKGQLESVIAINGRDPWVTVDENAEIAGSFQGFGTRQNGFFASYSIGWAYNCGQFKQSLPLSNSVNLTIQRVSSSKVETVTIPYYSRFVGSKVVRFNNTIFFRAKNCVASAVMNGIYYYAPSSSSPRCRPSASTPGGRQEPMNVMLDTAPLSRSDVTLPPDLQPTSPLDESSGDAQFFILDDGKTGVLTLGSFSWDSVYNGQNILTSGFQSLQAATVTQPVIVNISNNGGGYTCLVHRGTGTESLDFVTLALAPSRHRRPKSTTEPQVGLDTEAPAGPLAKAGADPKASRPLLVDVVDRLGQECQPFVVTSPDAPLFDARKVAIVGNEHELITMAKLEGAKTVVVGGKKTMPQHRPTDFTTMDTLAKTAQLKNNSLAPPDFLTNSVQGIAFRLGFGIDQKDQYEESQNHQADVNLPLTADIVDRPQAIWKKISETAF